MLRTSYSLTDCIADYLAVIEFRLSKNTVEAYKRDIEQFSEFLKGFKVTKPTQLKERLVAQFFCMLKEKQMATATIKRKFQSVRFFCNFLVERQMIQDGLFANLEVGSAAPFKIHVPSASDIQKLIECTDLTCEEGVRDRAIMELLYSSGLRASELCDLAVGDITHTQVRVESSKGDKTRTVPITQEALFWVQQYLNEFRPGYEHDDYLFQLKQGGKITRQYLHTLIAKYAKKMNIKNFSVHTFRHSCATHLLEAGADIRFLQVLLGHSNIQMTARYTTITSASLTQAFNLTHPRGKNVLN